MNFKTKKNERWGIHWTLLAMIALCFVGCKDDDETTMKPYDPSKPVVVTDFIPKEGGGGTRMVLYGENFGTDPSLLHITVGGKEAIIINALGNSVYCILAPKSYNHVSPDSYKGDVKLSISVDDNTQIAEANEKFTYVRQMVVSTLCGHTDEKGNFDVKDGPFDDCGGFQEPTWLSFDPLDHRYLYMAQDNGKPMRMLDLEKRQVYTVLNNGSNKMGRMRTITWTAKGDTMVIANDAGGEGDVNNSYLARDGFGKNAFTVAQTLQIGKQCNGSAIHPINNELYYNCFGMGEVFKYDYWGARKPDGQLDYTKAEKLYNIQDRDWEFNIQIHPSGDYAYIVVINHHYMLRTDYNWKKKTFGTPYLICGAVNADAWVDKFGDQARLNSPYQGIFVKNKKYVEEGRADIYDFYFCDRDNHCVRILTPDGSVTTFAGRGSMGTSLNAAGYNDGEIRKEARFNRPVSIAYDEKGEAFYIGDWNNHRIRKIALEEADEANIEESN